MQCSKALKLLLQFLPLENQKVYLLDAKGYTLDEIAIKLDLSLVATTELLRSTRTIIKKLIFILLETKEKDFPISLTEASTIKNALIEECIQIGKLDLEKELEHEKRVDEMLANCKDKLFKKLFPEA